MMHKAFESELATIKNAKTVYIYGAGDVSREVYFCLSNKLYGINVSAFIISNISAKTPDKIENIPVMAFDDGRLDRNAVVVIAVLEKYRDEICNFLDSVGMTSRILMTFESDFWSVIRSRLFEHYCEEKEYPYLFNTNVVSCDSSDNSDELLKVYVTRSTKDKPIKSTFEKKCWEEEVLAGAALDSISQDCVRDNTGINISSKNRKYCELTVMYWVWKNCKSEYVGLSHYRRRFDFSDNEIKKITTGELDVIVTTPMINVPNVKYMYGKNHNIEDWEKMLKVVAEKCPEYTQAVETVEKSNYYVPYNMFIMKWEIFDKYCEWLFPILDKCEQLIGDYEDVYQNRYIGFLAERLMTAYIFKHRGDFNIMFCNKHFLE